MLTTPILFLIFNRPDTTHRVFERIREIKPKQLFIAADGPRENREGEKEKCDKARNIINNIDWACEVKTLFRDKNLGCGMAVNGAITWFFDHVNQGIILEDDTLPNTDFFLYCEQLLNLYQDSDEIMHISGSNYADTKDLKESYYFSKFPFIWGWATWSRAWKKYQFNYKYLPLDEKQVIINQNFASNEIREYWLSIYRWFEYTPKSFTWDYQWFLSIWLNQGLVIMPKKNLTENIGFGGEATHTTQDEHPLSNVKAQQLEIITHPENKVVDLKLQLENFHAFFSPKIHISSFQQSRSTFNLFIWKIKFKLSQWTTHLLLQYRPLLREFEDSYFTKNMFINSLKSERTKLYPPYRVYNSTIGDYTYVSQNSSIKKTMIGKFCSIGPNLTCGWGIHPLNGISTSPMFYSKNKQNGYSLSANNKIDECKTIKIGNDVFIGMNVSILDGVTIGDGAVVGAGTVVSKDVPPYHIAVGSPMQLIRKRFDDSQIEALMRIKWWDFDVEHLNDVEQMFYDVDGFISKFDPQHKIE